MKRKYPTMLYFRNIPTDKRVCSRCGHKLYGCGEFMFMAVLPGKYLCHECSDKRLMEQEAHNEPDQT